MRSPNTTKAWGHDDSGVPYPSARPRATTTDGTATPRSGGHEPMPHPTGNRRCGKVPRLRLLRLAPCSRGAVREARRDREVLRRPGGHAHRPVVIEMVPPTRRSSRCWRVSFSTVHRKWTGNGRWSPIPLPRPASVARSLGRCPSWLPHPGRDEDSQPPAAMTRSVAGRRQWIRS